MVGIRKKMEVVWDSFVQTTPHLCEQCQKELLGKKVKVYYTRKIGDVNWTRLLLTCFEDCVEQVHTIKMDSMGVLHIWKGVGVVSQIAKYRFEMNGKETESLVTNSQDIAQIMSSLHLADIDTIQEGYPTPINYIDLEFA